MIDHSFVTALPETIFCFRDYKLENKQKLPNSRLSCICTKSYSFLKDFFHKIRLYD